MSLAADLDELVAVEVDVDGLLAVPPGDDDDRRPESVNLPRQLRRVEALRVGRARAARQRGQRSGLQQVGGNDR